MRLSKETISKRYASYDTRVLEFLNNVYDDIRKQNPDITNYFLVTFDLLANQLKLYYMAWDAIDEEQKISSEDAYKRVAKNPAIAVMTKAHQEICRILDNFSLSPFGQAKLKRVQKDDSDESAENLVASLIS